MDMAAALVHEYSYEAAEQMTIFLSKKMKIHKGAILFGLLKLDEYSESLALLSFFEFSNIRQNQLVCWY